MLTPRAGTRGIWSVLLFVLFLGLLALRAETIAARGGGALDPALCAADGANTFSAGTIDNAYFPLPAGGSWVYTGVDEGRNLGLRITVTESTESLYSGAVVTRVVEETEWADTDGNGVFEESELPIEISQNYFAQAGNGTVCYFGEHVDIYDDQGELVSNDGSWRADQPGHAPGIFMPAAPKEGMKFAQEIAPGIAEDQASVVGTGTETVPAGTFSDTIRIKETNPLDGGKGYKTYAEGVGLIVDGPVRLRESTLVATAAAPSPEPIPASASEAPMTEPSHPGRGKDKPHPAGPKR